MSVRLAVISAALGAAVVAIVMLPILAKKNRELVELRQRLSDRPKAEPLSAIPSIAGKGGSDTPAQKKKAAEQSRVAAQRERQRIARERGGDWAKDVQQIGDAGLKTAALDRILDALASADIAEIDAGFAAWQGVGSVEFDRGPFRAVIEALLEHADGGVRAQALKSLPGLPKSPSDYQQTIAMASDEDDRVRKAVVSNLFWLGGGDLTGEGGEAVLKVLEQVDAPNIQWYGTLWGARMTPELESMFVEWGQRDFDKGPNGSGYRVMYQTLSTQQNKGPECVDYLISCLAAPDTTNVAGRAAWGLGYGVQPGHGSEQKIADAAIEVFANRRDPSLRQTLLKMMRQYSDAQHVPKIEEIAALPALGEAERAELIKIAAAAGAKD